MNPKVPCKRLYESMTGAAQVLDTVNSIDEIDGDLGDVGHLLDISHDFHEVMTLLFARLMTRQLQEVEAQRIA